MESQSTPFYRHIAQELQRSSFLNSFTQNLLEGKTRLQYSHLNLSARALLIAHAREQTEKNVLVITPDDLLAEDYWDDFCVLSGRENAHYLPDFEVLPYEERSPHYSIRATRLETIAHTVSDNPQIYTLSMRTLLRWMQPFELLQKNILTLRKGMEIDPAVLISDLVGMGYESDYQVSKVYQFAKRGGILDIFSPPQTKPFRLEFFGDEIVSVRSFSLSTQRSDAGELEQVTIIPARELSLHDISVDSPLLERVHDQGFFEGIENCIGLLFPSVQIFPEYFDPAKTIIFWSDFPYILEEQKELAEQVAKDYAHQKKEHPKHQIPSPEQIFASEEKLISTLNRFQSIFVSQTDFLFPQLKEAYTAHITGMESFYGDLNLLSEDIKNRQAEGETVFIQFDNQSQAHRMEILLEEYNLKINSYIGCLHQGISFADAGLAVYTDHEIFNRYKQKKFAPRFAPGEALVDYESLKPGDYIVHVDHGIGIFEGLKIVKIDGQEIECLSLKYADDDRIYVPTFQLQLVSRYIAEEGITPTLSKLGSKKWENTRQRAKKQIELVAADILKLYAERSKRKGISHEPDSEWQKELEESFIFEDTPDQKTATSEIKMDMESPNPMERLLCGDVGFGKTEVAIRAAFKAVVSGYQVAVLVPTTLLAEQHYRVFKERLAQYPVRIAMFSRFRSSAQIKSDLVALTLGQIDIAIGTHRLLSNDVRFRHLGLLIVDEEHRFGVRHKEKLRKLQSNVDTLYMSATPIPRTLNMALSKLKDISLIQTSPKERFPIRTIVTLRDMQVIKEAIQREIDRNGQVFFIHNRIQSIESVAQELRTALPNVRFAIGHAQMKEAELEKIMEDFVNHKYDVLISTTIIENGIDIPNANTILIDRADTFGLAQLYQMRGRVGRSNRRAYAYLLLPKGTTTQARQRLDALTQYDYLGAGFQVAMRDLEIRGAGTVLGIKQSGVIQAIGYNYYNKLLEKAIESIQSEHPENFYREDYPETRQKLKTEIDLYFPPDYIADDKERLRIYRRLNNCTDIQKIDDFANELTDRFGKLPDKAAWLLTYYKLKILTQQANLHNCQVRNGELIMEFKQQAQPSRDKILAFLQAVKEPVRIDTSANVKIFITLSEKADLSYREQIRKAIDILSVYNALS
ncbi:MAG TPA: transcription-repair coupling factor [Candidatus Cloacimonadota bacterium]|nr:transcription-repair coupling factor [Candidatus Cloacimonadota bacterium]